jgi:hypothetical protein
MLCKKDREFQKERKEHPSFGDATICRIVQDHIRSSNIENRISKKDR